MSIGRHCQIRSITAALDSSTYVARSIGGGTIPDVTFSLPQGRALHMDVKFPADNYLRFLEAEGDADRDRFRTAFLRDVRARLKELAGRGYTEPESTVGFLLMFIPNESVYAFIHQHDPGLIDTALAQKVVVCSPCTLFPVLAVIGGAAIGVVVVRRRSKLLASDDSVVDSEEVPR